MTGKLYGIGVGPGDPELLTLKAKRLIEECDVIAVPVSGKGKGSVALNIVRDYIPEKKEIREFLFPMSFDSKELKQSWTESFKGLCLLLDSGRHVAMLTLGDPTVYSTYIYIHKQMLSNGYEAEIIPGITSFCGAAARAGISLVESSESLMVLPSAYKTDMEKILDSGCNLVLMKVAKNLESLRTVLEQRGLDKSAVVVSKCGFEDEKIYYGLDGLKKEELSYFTTMIVKRNGAGK